MIGMLSTVILSTAPVALNPLKSTIQFLDAWIFLLIVSLCSSVPLPPEEKPDPECNYNITQLIQNKGYPCEEHKVLTKGGYILGVFRIPHGRNSSSSGRTCFTSTWPSRFSDNMGNEFS